MHCKKRKGNQTMNKKTTLKKKYIVRTDRAGVFYAAIAKEQVKE